MLVYHDNKGKIAMNIPEKLVANEEKIATLYEAYSAQFNDYADFWKRMANEETIHAAIIRKCIEELEEGLVRLDKKRFNEQALITYSEYLGRELDAANEPRLSLIHALSTALYIEQSLIEAKFFEAF
jgi:rubrerythrin